MDCEKLGVVREPLESPTSADPLPNHTRDCVDPELNLVFGLNTAPLDLQKPTSGKLSVGYEKN